MPRERIIWFLPTKTLSESALLTILILTWGSLVITSGSRAPFPSYLLELPWLMSTLVRLKLNAYIACPFLLY